jgi:replicative DNA helicase Mcm
MSSIQDLDISDDLKRCGVTRLAKENTKFLLEYQGESVIIFDIEDNELFATLQNLEDRSKGKINRQNQEAIKFCLSKDQHYVDALLSNGKTTPGVAAESEKESDVSGADKIDFQPEPQDDTRVISVSEAQRRHSGSLQVQGMITSLSQLYKMVTVTNFECLYCGTAERTLHDIPVLLPPIKTTCVSCDKNMMRSKSHEYVNAVTVELQDTDTFSEIERLPVVLFDNDTKNIHVGERVSVSGRLHVIQQKGRSFPFVYAQAIEYESREEIILTARDIEGIERFAKLKDSFSKLISLFAPSIIGYDHVKKGLLLCAANAVSDNQTKRSRLHAILVGDPGLAKSALLREATKLVLNSRYESGQNSSGKSLTAIVAKEDESYVLRLGPASLAKGAICAVNELGRIMFQDQAYLLDIMEEGEYTINKHGINARIKAPTTIIASANPVNNSTFLSDDRIDLDEIPAIKPLIDRFDLLFVFRTPRNTEDIRKYAYKKSELDNKIIPDYYNFLRKYILYSKRFNPVLNDEAKAMLTEYWVDLAGRFGSPRILETLFRLAKATARLKLKKAVDSDDAQATMQFYNVILEQHKQVVSIPDNPRDVVYNECLGILKESSQFSLSFSLEELVITACQRNEHVKRYIGDRFKLENNIKLRPVRDMLLNHSSIKMVQQRPIVLQWIEDISGKETGNTLSDATDVSDSQRHSLNQKFNQYFMIKMQQSLSSRVSDASDTSDSTSGGAN